MDTKTCKVCDQEKDLDAFYRNAGRTCKECAKVIAKERRKDPAYRKKVNAIGLRSRHKHPRRYWAGSTIRSHKHRGFDVQITIEDVYQMSLETDTCLYCGEKLVFAQRGGKPVDASGSLDRINNENVMTKDNVRVICYSCNRTKGPRTHDEFVAYCRKVGGV